MEESVAHAVAAVGGRLFISGGFGGVALGRLLALTLPPDPCRLLPSPEACLPCMWGLSSRLLQQSAAATSFLRCGVAPLSRCFFPQMWGSSSQPLLLSSDVG